MSRRLRVLVPRFFFKTRIAGLPWSSPVCLLMVLAVSFQAGQAQQTSKEARKNQDEAIKLKTHLVTLDVMVKDNKGKYVTDLKAQDFAVSENGVPQVVEFFDPPLVSGGETGIPGATEATRSSKPSGGPSNILSLVLDGATTDLTNLKQVREGTLKYIRERITTTDTVAVFGVSTDLRLLQPFTQDKAKLISAVENAYLLTASNKNLEQSHLAEDIERAREAAGAGATSLPASPAAAAQGRAGAEAMIAARALEQFIKLRSQLSAQQARPVLAALAALCEAQRSIPGKKTVVLFSQGFVAPTILDWQVQSVIDIANRSNVAIYIIDSAGLRTSAPLSTSPVPAAPLSGVSGTMSTESRMRAVGGEDVFDIVRHEGLNREYDILYRISGDTGGEFIKGTNDLSKALDRIDQGIRSRYTLAYSSTDANFDGRFRKIKVEVRRPDAHVASRSGYYANPGDDIVPLSPEDRKLLEGLPSVEASPALPLFLQLSPFRFKEGRYVVPLSIEVPPSAMQFDRRGNKHQVQFEVLGVVRQTPDKILARLGGNFDIALTAEQYQAILNNNIFYRQDMELAPGTYSIELLFRDKLSGKMAGKKEALVLPEANAEFSTSGVVLSRQAAKYASAAQGGVDVLSQQGVQIRPFPSRQFRATENLIIFFELYNAAINSEMGKPLVRVTVTLLKEGGPVTRPMDYVLTETLTQPVPHLIFAKFISLAGLTPGNYTAAIEAKDTVTHKLVTQQVPFVIKQ
jgi:VWFA-related protein